MRVKVIMIILIYLWKLKRCMIDLYISKSKTKHLNKE